MNTIKSYEAIAREAGYCVEASWYTGSYRWYWYQQGGDCEGYYSTSEEAWKSCCVDNGLLGE